MRSFIIAVLLSWHFSALISLQNEHPIWDAEQLVRYLPKVELHAHLSGSVRLSTLKELYEQSGKEHTDLTVYQFSGGQVEKPFELFPLIHQAIQSSEAVLRILHEMIEDYMNENTVYLEIRTSPRDMKDGTTAEEYVRILVQAVAAHNARLGHILMVKLILSVDRSKTFANAQNVLMLLKHYSNLASENGTNNERTIVGLDFSGNPMGGKFSEFAPVFREARSLGYNLTVHTAEARDTPVEEGSDDLEDTDYILSFRPDRLGHMLHLKDRHLRLLWMMKEVGTVPLIEICPSTSFFVLDLHSFADHPYLRKFRSMNYPVSINTDDSTIFNSTITKEILHMKSALDWTLADVIDIQETSLQYAFASSNEKSMLLDRFWQSIDDLREKYPKSTLENIKRPSSETPEADMSSLYTM